MDTRRPSRSDEHLLPAEEARIEAETREYFDEIAPKCHTKPCRSDPDPLLVLTPTPSPAAAIKDAPAIPIPIPEFCKFQDLQQTVPDSDCDGNKSNSAEEYTATHYYDDLNSMDKHHHTTGTGFIKMDDLNPNPNPNPSTNRRYCEIASDGDGDGDKGDKGDAWNHHHPSNSNPATNDWIPSSQTQTQTVILASNKPTRSDN